MTTGRLPAALALLTLCAGAAQATPRDHVITPEDYFTIAHMSDLTLSGNGKQATWVQSYWDKQSDGQKKDLWRMTLPKGTPERLTFSEENEGHPQFSADGRYLYFLKAESRGEDAKAPYNGKAQIFRLNLTSSEVVPLTRSPEGISQFTLGPQGQALWYTSNKEHKSDDPFAGLRSTHDAPQYGHGTVTVNPLYRLDLASYRSELVLDDNKVVWGFDISPDGNRIARVITDDNELVHLEGWSDVHVYDRQAQRGATLPDDAWRAQAPSPYGWLMQPRWSPDGTRLAFRIDYDGHPGQLFVTELDRSGQVVGQADLTRPGDATLNGDNIAWRPGSDEICYRASEHARVRLYCTEMDGTEQGATRSLTEGDFVVGGFAFSAKGRELALTHNGLDHFYELYSGRVGRTPERRTNINPQTAAWQLPQLSIVRWTAPDGSPVEGILELPHGYQKSDGPLPLVVQIHGGPTAATPYALQHRTYGRSTFAARGWALLSPNYRGSTGFGDRFLVDLVGREHDIEVADIQAGVDNLIAQGLVDAEKLAVMGWSNGGYLTNALISTSNRFKAASSGAGVWDQRLQWILEDTPGHVINFMQGLPWEQPEAYTHGSSLSHAANITTPTVIHMGEKDARVPAPHAYGLYRTLKQYLEVPTELLIYPGEGHGLSTYRHKLAKMQWDLAWFEHHVLGKPVE
ncbi:alpha/beta hydrolase family protein [Ferrimonas balearica]|uniref:S9 family peptidase n=1 Tax=Ferrimonas balearica TaxID=44012 RepID=UPI001C996699|nr:S9 family peptidase [Ferrimonas balearica]MBY5993321.1 S9 family peptidase [Ferrimonas balearica]